MNWRPEGWRNPYKHSDSVQAWDIPEAYYFASEEEWITYEAGADAMLDILKVIGIKVEARSYLLADESDRRDIIVPKSKGWLVFIPDEEIR